MSLYHGICLASFDFEARSSSCVPKQMYMSVLECTHKKNACLFSRVCVTCVKDAASEAVRFCPNLTETTVEDSGATGIPPLSPEDLLSCGICNEAFNVDTRLPKLLHCFHTFCTECVQNLTKDGRLRCPKCRQEIAADESFPMDTTRVALMNLKWSGQSSEGMTCEVCAEGGKATSRCEECSEHLCGHCSQYHLRFKATKDHTLVSLPEGAMSPEKLLQASEKCGRHADEKLKLFCMTCSQAVCSVCTQTLHGTGHEVVELDSILEDKRQQVPRLFPLYIIISVLRQESSVI